MNEPIIESMIDCLHCTETSDYRDSIIGNPNNFVVTLVCPECKKEFFAKIEHKDENYSIIGLSTNQKDLL